MKKFNLSVTALFLTIFIACQKSNSPAPINNAPLSDTLRINLGETIVTSNFSIKLDSADDSRCTGVCIWAGEAKAKLIVQQNNNTEVARMLLDPTQKNTINKALVFNKQLHLLDVLRDFSTPNIYAVKLLLE